MSQEKMDDEPKETLERLDRIMQIMYQEAQGSWRHECPMKKNMKWPIE
jgi:hypothetical protein